MSRFITYPSTVQRDSVHTVLVVDAIEQDMKRLELFLKVCRLDFDVYFYETKVDDLQWVSHVSELVDAVLVNNTSSLQSTNSTTIRYGHGLDTIDPLAYFEHIDSSSLE